MIILKKFSELQENEDRQMKSRKQYLNKMRTLTKR